jgi:integrase
LEKRATSRFIHARAFIQGKLLRKTTRTANLREAKRVATAWWQELSVRDRRGERLHVPTFSDCAAKYLARRRHDAEEAKTLSKGQYRNLVQKEALLRPLIGDQPITAIDEDFLRRLRTTREGAKNKLGDGITQSTIKKDVIFIHSVLMFARDTMRILPIVPKMPSFSGEKAIVKQGRPYLTEEEYKRLHQLAKTQADEPDLNPRTRRQRLSLYYYILISVGGALRVSEAESVRWCDCEETKVITPDGAAEDAVLMYVMGKHAKGGKREKAYVMFGGVWAYQQMKAERADGAAETDLLFPEAHREGMKRLLKEAGLYEFRDPETERMRTRDRKSLRPTAITLRLDKGDNLTYRAVAEWARTSPLMIEEFYDQLHPAKAAGEVATFRKRAKPDADDDE